MELFDLNVFFDVRILAKQSLLNLDLNKNGQRSNKHNQGRWNLYLVKAVKVLPITWKQDQHDLLQVQEVQKLVGRFKAWLSNWNKMNKVSHCLLALLLIYRRNHLEYHKEAGVLHENVPVEVFCPALIQPGKPWSHHLRVFSSNLIENIFLCQIKLSNIKTTCALLFEFEKKKQDIIVSDKVVQKTKTTCALLFEFDRRYSCVR